MPPRNKRKHEAAAEEGRDVLGAHANDGIKKTTGAAAATESDRRMTLRSDETGTGKRLEEHSPPSSPPGQKKKKLKKSTAAGDDECDDEDDKQQPSTPSKPRETVKAQQRGRTEQAHASAPLADVISINRAPVLTLWAAVVAAREGFSWPEALTFGRSIAGMFAQAKGRSIGVFEEPEDTEAAEERRERRRQGTELVRAFGRSIRARTQPDGSRLAAEGSGAVHPGSVEAYLRRSFGPQLDAARAALEALAGSIPAEEIGRRAYDLYTDFRPSVSGGRAGWGQRGGFSLQRVRDLAAIAAA